ncbi:hypothetical protein AC579_8875 [Pseudocercospora musae]|uniref:Flavin reductase like domain-containing protein n=1 Tax=Pseudocercospora musae TaxID=113226 RepID=A0A139I504_9PEZI|nr:hypothetical protein AC579_8875 [Pseudocercospora musae]
MHRHGFASRRFYRAFYRWTLVNDSHAAGDAGARACRYAFHTSTSTDAGHEDLATRHAPLRKEDANAKSGNRSRGDQDVPIRFHGAKFSGKHTFRTTNYKTRQERYGSCPKKFIEGQIYSATAKPFRTLQSGEAVVRYRSDLGLVIEYAVRSDGLERILKDHGPNLETFSKKHGARVEVQNLFAPIPPAHVGGATGLRNVSVLISGSFAEVGDLYNDLHGRGSIVPLMRVGHEHVKSALQRPSHTLRPLEHVIRHKSDATCTLEISLLESHFMRFVAAHDTTVIAARNNVSIDVGEPEQRSASEVSDKVDAARSFVITGSPQDVTNALHSIKHSALTPRSTRGDLNTNGQRDRAVKPVQSSKRVDDDTKATAKNIPERPASSTVDRPDAGNRKLYSIKVLGSKQYDLLSMLEQRRRSDMWKKSDWHKVRRIHDFLVVRTTPEAFTRIQSLVKQFVADTCQESSWDNHQIIAEPVGESSEEVHQISIEGARATDLMNIICGVGKRNLPGLATHSGCSQIHPTYTHLRACGPIDAVDRLRASVQEIVWEMCTRNSWEQHEVLLDGVKVQNTPSPASTSAFPDRPLWVTVKGPSQASIIRKFIGTGLELEELRKGLGLQVLQPQRWNRDIRLFVEGTPAACNRIKDKLHDFIQATSSKAGYAEHSVKVEPAPSKAQRSPHALSAKEKAQLSEDIRMISRTLTHPVVHISANDTLAERDGQFGQPRGLTVSSFNTITLAPQPIISFNIKVPSRTWDAIYASQRLRVTILTATSRGAAIAHAFTQPFEHPSEPFEKLRSARVKILPGSSNTQSPTLWDDIGGGILANMQAHLLPDKCVQVGDHVVVVAKVYAFSPASKLTNKMALSYAARSYRSAGEAIEPVELSWSALQSEDSVQREAIEQEDVEDELDALDLGSNVGFEHHGQAEGHISSPSASHEALSSPPEQDGKLFHKDPLYHALRLTSDASTGGKDIDIYQEFSKFSEPIDDDFETSKPERNQQAREGEQQEYEKRAAVARAEEDEYDFGFDRPRHAHKDPLGAFKRPYSTSAPLPSFNNRRFYSTATYKATDLSAILDPTTSQTTVSDYLCLPDARRPYTPRVRGLIKRKLEIDTARTRLTSDGSRLEPSKISELENLISTNERIIAKRLAWNATVDLRFMLDKGRYDAWFFSRVGWFESTIEKGQAVLLEEAKVLKTIFEEGKVGREKYDLLAEKLKGDFEVLITETRRLARVFEENGEMGED